MILAAYRAFARTSFRGKALVDHHIRRAIGEAVIATKPGFLISLDPMEWTQVAILQRGEIEPLTCALMREILRPGDTYIDVGAHVGFHTLVARQCVGESGRVIAIEPQPYNCERILQNWRLNGFANVELYVAAAGEKAGMVRLHAQAATDKARLSLALPGVNDESQAFHVPLLRVDDLAGVARLVKIDAEGFEPEVLAGMKTCRAENIILELLPAADDRARMAVEILRERGYTLRSVNGSEFRLPLPESNAWAHRVS